MTDTSKRNEQNPAFKEDPALYNKETKAVPAPGKEIGIDTDNTLYQNIILSGTSGSIDLNALNNFTTISQSRDLVYALLDTMCQDSTVAAVVETYAEDATEYNDNGYIVWAESSDPAVQKYVQFLLDTMNVDKHIYKWTLSLCKYGDIYLKLFRESDYQHEDLFKSFKQGKKVLNEAFKIKAYSANDHFVNYVEMWPNPAEIFELTKNGKTYAYIEAPVTSQQSYNFNDGSNTGYSYLQYRFKKSDVVLHSATDFVHGTLEDSSGRTPEKIQLMLGDNEDEADSLTYTVRRGQSLLYNTFKTWRELQLLEQSVLLNRLTKSSIVRLINVQVGDMPKEQVGPHLQGIKSLFEQKTAINQGNSLQEYTNPGPVENNVYVPVRGEVGNISVSAVGGDVDVKSLTDLDHYTNKYFGSVRIPKQYFGFTDDGAGFNGGQSLSIISSRYGKMIKRIQNAMIQTVTDVINLFLLDRGLSSYINQFTIRMLPPTTQEEIDRRENRNNRIGMITDIMNNLSDIEDSVTKLKIVKTLLSNVITDQEVTQLIQDEIDKMETAEEEANQTPEEVSGDGSTDEFADAVDATSDSSSTSSTVDYADFSTDIETNSDGDSFAEDEVIIPVESEDDYLPTPDELGIDLTVNT